eukprot:470774-Pyramimonas_sp.AAC.1
MPKTVVVAGQGNYGSVDPLQTVFTGSGLTEAIAGNTQPLYVTLQNALGAFLPYTAETAASLSLGPWPYDLASTAARTGTVYAVIVPAGESPADLAADHANLWNFVCDVVTAPMVLENEGLLEGSLACEYTPANQRNTPPSGEYEIYFYVRAAVGSAHVQLAPPFELVVVSNLTSAETSTLAFGQNTRTRSDNNIAYLLGQGFTLDNPGLVHVQAGDTVSDARFEIL